jgi:hypothetical protein
VSELARASHYVRRMSMQTRFSLEVAAAGLPSAPPTIAVVDEGDLEGLPAAARDYLRFMKVVGRPRD